MSIPDGPGTVTPWLISRDSAELIRFLEAAFGATEISGSRMHNADGSIAHAEVRIGSSIVMLCDSYEGWPKTPGFFRLYLEDADASYRQALGAGATSVAEVTELIWGDRIGRVRDPFGNVWWLQSHATDVPYDRLRRLQLRASRVRALPPLRPSFSGPAPRPWRRQRRRVACGWRRASSS